MLNTKNNERILIIDDEKGILTGAKVLLKTLGFNVTTANSGLEGVEKFLKNKDSISHVILDYSMPKMNGMETLLEIRKHSVRRPVFISSGYLTLETEEKLTDSGASGFLHKPYETSQLLSIIEADVVNI